MTNRYHWIEVRHDNSAAKSGHTHIDAYKWVATKSMSFHWL